MSLLFKMLSRFVIAFLPRSKHLLISWLQSTTCNDFGDQENKVCHCFHCFPIYLPDPMIFALWMLSFSQLFHSPLSPSSRNSLVPLHILPLEWYHLTIWGCWYFSPAILILACASSSPAFLMMYSAFKLNKQGDNIQPCRTPFPILNQSIVSCSILTVASWPAYRFLRRQVRCLVFPSLSEFSTVYCDPHSQRLWHSQ